MVKTLVFIFDETEVINNKVKRIERIIGSDNVNKDGLYDTRIPSINISCTYRQWRKIKFMCGLNKVYC